MHHPPRGFGILIGCGQVGEGVIITTPTFGMLVARTHQATMELGDADPDVGSISRDLCCKPGVRNVLFVVVSSIDLFVVQMNASYVVPHGWSGHTITCMLQ